VDGAAEDRDRDSGQQRVARHLTRYKKRGIAVSSIASSPPGGRRIPPALRRALPIFDWGASYNGATLANDLLAAVIVTIMLIPQSLAYALLAGLPPEAGLYASILPLVAYAMFGSSRTLAVGPVAVISLMTASAAGKAAAAGVIDHAGAALLLALLSGLFLMLMGVFRLGLIANFLSHPVTSGFITASGLIIAVSQLKHILGVKASGDNLLDLLTSLLPKLGEVNVSTLFIGVSVTAFLFWSRSRLKPMLTRRGWGLRTADFVAKSAPVAAVGATTLAVWGLALPAQGVAIVGDIPQGLPPLTLPGLDPAIWRELAAPALLISLVGFVESVSVAQTLAAKRRQRIQPDQELIGLGAANIAASVTGGYPVTGGFARSVVNFDAGAETPAAGAFTAVGILMAALLLTPLLYYLPQATLAATIIVAVLSLVDLGAIRRTWDYSRADFAAMAVTIAATLILGVESGIVSGVATSIALHLWRTSRPHCAIVGQVPGTEHFRNVKRHDVAVCKRVVTIRIDESLYFPNARFLEERIIALAADCPEVKHVILMCPAVNHIDASALESLEAINRHLRDACVAFHLSEVKGPVLDRLRRSHFLDELTGQVFLSQYQAMKTLAPDVLC
jgi:SulP family sulfate permease